MLRRAAHADERAAATIYVRHAPRMLGVARRVLGNVADAEDVVHDAFMAALAKADETPEERWRLDAFLLVLTRMKALDRYRNRVTRREAPLEEGVADTRPVLENAQARVLRGELQEKLASLPPEQAKVVDLAWRGHTEVEIAAETGEARGTVASRLRLGVARLKRLFGVVAEDAGARSAAGGDGS